MAKKINLDETQKMEPEDYTSEEGWTLMWVFVLLMIIYAAVFLVKVCLHAS